MGDSRQSRPCLLYGLIENAPAKVMLPSPRQTARMMRRKLLFAVCVGDSFQFSLLPHDTSQASVTRTHILKALQRTSPSDADPFHRPQCLLILTLLLDSLLGARSPPGMVAIGTVCGVTLNGILLHHCIPVESKFGGLLEMRGGKPFRFIELVSYAGTSIDPLQIFITGRLTSAHEAALTGNGKVGAGFREIPAAALPRALEVIDRMNVLGLGGVLANGAPSQQLLDLPVGMDRAGLVVVGGLTPLAAAAEHDIEVVNRAMSTTCDFAHLRPIGEL